MFDGDSPEAIVDIVRSAFRDLDCCEVVSITYSSSSENGTHTPAAFLSRHSRQFFVGADLLRLGAKSAKGFSCMQ
jgi:hypothetical protein